MSLGLTVLLLSVATTILRLRFNGPALADTIEIILNSDIRGRVEIESVEWPLGSLPKVATGGWVPVKIRGLKVFDDGGMQGLEVDDSKRELLLETDLLTAEIDVHSLMFGHHDFVVRNLQIPNGGYVLLRQVDEPYPLHLYDTSMVSLATAFYSRLQLGLWAGVTATSSKIFDIRDFDIRNVTVEIIYPATHIIAENVSTKGFVRSDFSDPLKAKVYFALAPTAERGLLCVGDLVSDRGLEKPYRSMDDASAAGTLCSTQTLSGETRMVSNIPLLDIRIARMTQLPHTWPLDPIAHDVEFAMTAHTPFGSDLIIDGALRNYWLGYYGGDFDIDLRIANGGPLMSLLTEELTGGDNVRLRARVTGPSLYPKVALDIDDVDIRLFEDLDGPPLNLHLAHASAALDMVTRQGTLENTVARGAGGQVDMSAFFDLDGFKFKLDADISKPIFVGPYLPKEALSGLGEGIYGAGRLAGKLQIAGDSDILEMSKLDLELGDARISGKLYTENSEVIYASGLDVRIGETVLSTNGSMDIGEGDVDLNIDLHSTDLSTHLRRLDIPAVARSATGTARVRGTANDPRAHVELSLGGVQIIRKLGVNLDYRNNELILNEALSDAARNGLDGTLRASGRIRMGKTPEIVEFNAVAERLDLARIPLFGGLLGGRVSGKASATGRLNHLQAQASTRFDGLTIAGDGYDFSRHFNVSMQPDGSMELGLAVERIGGGTLSADAAVDSTGALQGALLIETLPLHQLGILGGIERSPVGGVLSTSLDLRGTLDAPTADGDIKWFRGWFGETFLGGSALRVETVDEGVIELAGTLMQGDVDIAVTLATSAPYDTTVEIDLRRVELDRLLPAEYTQPYKARGWVSGKVRATTPLLPVPGRPLELTANLSEVQVSIANEDPSGRPAPIHVRNKATTPIEIHYRGDKLTLRKPVTLIGPGGVEFGVSGRIDGQLIRGSVEGEFDLALIQPYLRARLDSITGKLAIAAKVEGTLDKPELDALLVLGDQQHDIIMHPVGQDTLITIPGGGIVRMTNEQLSPTGLSLIVQDNSDDSGKTDRPARKQRLNIRGGVKLENFVPTELGVQIDGHLAGRMLVILAPEVFSRASGYAEVHLAISGTLTDPEPLLEIYMDPELELSLTPRGLRRELKFSNGEISLDRNRLVLAGIDGTIDDEGRFRDIDGVVSLRNWEPVDIRLAASADTVTYRVPGELELTFNINDLRVTSREQDLPTQGQPGQEAPIDVDAAEFAPVSNLIISGDVEVVDGRYVRDFNLIKDALIPANSGGSSSSTPFYEDIPIIGDARLALTIDTRGFFVQNNLADIQLGGQVTISGQVRDPKLDGEVRVSQGEFKLPGVRARFTRTQGSVSFSRFKSFPNDTPTLDVSSESDYRDPSGQEHLMTLSIAGTIDALDWDLYTSSGLNKGQTVTMLFSGRTPEEFRKTLGDDSPGRDPSRVETSTDPNANIADQLLKDLAGDFISLLIEDKLRNLTTLDVARLEIGTGSIGFHAEKELLQNLRILGDLEQTLRGRTYDVRGEFRLTDSWSFEGEHLQKNFEDDSEEDISETRVRAVWRRFFY